MFGYFSVRTLRAAAAAIAFAGIAAAAAAQSLTEVIIPQFIQGLNGTNSTRVPFAYRVTLTGLSPGATYRYFNQVVTASDAATVNGAGNCIFVTASGDFVRTTGPSMATAGNYSEFTADGSGNYTGWFATEPSGNTRFAPGNELFLRIMLNDGAGGTTVAARPTTTTPITVINFGGAGPNTGTGIRCTTTNFTAKNFVLLYDNEAGTGRPLTATFVESDGTDNSGATSYVPFYGTDVNTVDKAFGAIIPNALPNGVRRVEERSRTTGAITAAASDADGVWPVSGTNTVNPSSGVTALVLLAGDLTASVEGWDQY